MRAVTSIAAVALLVSSATSTRVARADAVDPPPSCPSGETGVTDHGGGRCMKDPPKNCPPGWTGALGGTCIVHQCTSDAQCDGGTCREQSVCMKQYFRPNYGAAPASRGDTRLAALGPLPAEVGPPIADWAAESFCGAGNPCSGADHRCEPRKVCLPRGATAAAVVAPAADGSFPPPPSRGCAACAAGGERADAPLAIATWAVGLGLVAWRRRRTRRG